MTPEEKAEQVRADRERFLLDTAARYGMRDVELAGYGEWVAGLTDWTHFVTLTHRPPDRYEPGFRRDGSPVMLDTGVRIVGAKRHRRAVREWFFEDVRTRDGRAQWWSEMELHESGASHEHGLLRVSETAPVLSIRQSWWDRAGYATIEPIEAAGRAAVYVAKYTGKAAAIEPLIFGLRDVAVGAGSWADMHGYATTRALDAARRRGDLHRGF